MNLDFSNNAGFSFYVVLLTISGIAMLVMGAINVRQQTPVWRVINLLIGLGFIGYGVYLAFIFQGGTYIMFWQAFILPVLLIVRSFRSSATR